MSTQKSRRQYDEAFKREAVRLWRSSNRGADHIAHELGVSISALYAWANALEIPHVNGGTHAATSARDLKLENARLRAENERLRIQREVLKKTIAILSEPHKTPSVLTESKAETAE